MRIKIIQFILILTLLIPFSHLISPYSLFYIQYIEVYSYIFTFLFFILFFPLTKSMLSFKQKSIIVVYFVFNIVVIFIPILINQQVPFVNSITGLSFILFFILLKLKYRYWIYNRFITILSFVFLAGIIEELIFLFTGFYFNFGEVSRSTSNGEWLGVQGLFNIFPIYFETGIFRFQSLMDEPGRVGTICSFLLFTTNIKYYKKQFVVFVITGLLTLSLAYYIFLFIYILVNLAKINIKSLLLMFFLCFIIVVSFYDQVEVLIVNRIKNIEHIDNRTSYLFNKEIDEFLNSGDILWGKGNRSIEKQDWGGGNAGVKVAFFQYGIIGVFLILFSFILLFINCAGNSYYSWLIIFVYLLSFYQRADWNYSPNTVILFAYYLTPLYFDKEKNISKKNYILLS